MLENCARKNKSKEIVMMRIKNDFNLGWSTHIGGGRQRTRTRKEEKRKLEVAKMIKRRKAKKRGKEECGKASKEITTRQESGRKLTVS